jgi:cell wall-associated NlpC family hydrolase
VPQARDCAVAVPKVGTVVAPNARAAAAVRAACTQLGVPYQWGGESPGSALDCSGLTQWAYGQAGVHIPRTADAQAVGRFLGYDPKVAEPGDLLVWSGHVAMCVGGGQLVEAQQPGYPCAIDPLRVDNAGDKFLGVWRPTETEAA